MSHSFLLALLEQCWKFLIYLTNWGLLTVNFRLALDAILTGIEHFQGKRIARLDRILDTLYNLSNGLQLGEHVKQLEKVLGYMHLYSILTL